MKLRTHLVTGFSVAASLSLFLGLGPKMTILAGILALALNYLIDALGHRGLRRTPFLHSLLGVTLSTVAAFSALIALELYIPTLEHVGIALGPRLFLATYAGALSHLLLDTLTEGGTYLLYPFSKKRYALAHLDYNNPIANSLAIVGSLALLLYTAWIRYGYILNEVVKAWFAK